MPMSKDDLLALGSVVKKGELGRVAKEAKEEIDISPEVTARMRHLHEVLKTEKKMINGKQCYYNTKLGCFMLQGGYHTTRRKKIPPLQGESLESCLRIHKNREQIKLRDTWMDLEQFAITTATINFIFNREYLIANIEWCLHEKCPSDRRIMGSFYDKELRKIEEYVDGIIPLIDVLFSRTITPFQRERISTRNTFIRLGLKEQDFDKYMIARITTIGRVLGLIRMMNEILRR